MNIGVIARCDNRGLGNQTWEVARHLPDASVLVVHDPRSVDRGFREYPERFRGADHVTIDFTNTPDGELDESLVRKWLVGLDVVYTAETTYDWRLCDWARDEGARTVVHSNPEFNTHWKEPWLPLPDAWWNPTPWRQANMPRKTVIMQMPVPTDRWEKPDFNDNPREVLHIGGLEAVADRNGSQLIRPVAKLLSDYSFERTDQTGGHGPVDYWHLYDNPSPLMLLPRRFGGLCLPVLEAMGAGKAVMMPDTSPNRMWPIIPIPTYRSGPRPRTLKTGGGTVTLADTHPAAIAHAIEQCWPSIADHRRAAWEWAQKNSWETQLPKWLTELERVASL